MPLKLGKYKNSNQTPKPSRAPLSWRQSKYDSLSDYTIIIRTTNDDGTCLENRYHVHRNVLGAGYKRCDYFATLFRRSVTNDNDNDDDENDNDCRLVETQNNVSEISLAPTAAAAFPKMLDFLYSKDDVLDATTESATALRYLSNYFGACEMFTKVNGFIEVDLSSKDDGGGGGLSPAEIHDRVCVYWKEAVFYNDDELVLALSNIIAEHFELYYKAGFIMELQPEQLLQVVSESERLNCDSELLSKIVAQFLQSCLFGYAEFDECVVRGLTCPKKMPEISPDFVLFYLQLIDKLPLEEGFRCDDEEPDSLLSRCAQAYIRGHDCEVLLPSSPSGSKRMRSSASGGGRKRGKQQSQLQQHQQWWDKPEYESLSKDLRLRLMELAFYYKEEENQALKDEIRMLKRKNEIRKFVGSRVIDSEVLGYLPIRRHSSVMRGKKKSV